MTTNTNSTQDLTTQKTSQDGYCIGYILAKTQSDHLDVENDSKLSKEEKALKEAEEDIEYALQTAGSNLDKVKDKLSSILASLTGSTVSADDVSLKELVSWVSRLKQQADNYTPDASIQSQLDDLAADIQKFKDLESGNQKDLDKWQSAYDDDLQRIQYWGDKLEHGQWYEQIAAPFVLAGLAVALGTDALGVEYAKYLIKGDGDLIAKDQTKISDLEKQLDPSKSALAYSIETGGEVESKKAESTLAIDKQTDATIQTDLKSLDDFSQWLKDLIDESKTQSNQA